MRQFLLAVLIVAIVGIAFAGPARAQVNCGYVYDILTAGLPCTWNGTTISCPDPWIWSCTGGGGVGGSNGGGGGGGGGSVSASTLESLPLPTGDMANNITRGKKRAKVKVENFPACNGLFGSLGMMSLKTPWARINGAIYWDGSGNSTLCPPGRIAAGLIGGNYIIGCQPMSVPLTNNEMALTLIHEAVHLEGYSHDGGLNSADLDTKIVASCDLAE